MYKIWFKVNGQIARLDKEYKTKAGATKAGYKIFGKKLINMFIVSVECPYEKQEREKITPLDEII